VKILSESNGEGIRSQQIQFESEPGIVIDGTMYMPASPGKKPAVLLVAGKLSDWLAERVAKSGRVVLKVEPRPSFSQESRRPYVGDYLANRGVDVLAARDTELSDAVIPGFLLHWDLDDLTKAMGLGKSCGQTRRTGWDA
jgi:hypothetical protein